MILIILLFLFHINLFVSPCQWYEEFSAHCSGAGTYSCGICECDDAHFGRRCECDTNHLKAGAGDDMTAGCRPDNATAVDCSGRGMCVCGQCECESRANPEEQITGAFCECDNFSCDRYDGVLCSGPEQGTCECGQCVCKPGWTHGARGQACDCRTGNDTCVAPGGNGEVCSGRGRCECGKCRCSEEEATGRRYTGQFCEKCTWTKRKTRVSVYLMMKTNCRFEFVYWYNRTSIVVEAQKERQCPPQVFILGIVLGVIGAIVLIGLALLLLWKLLTTIHDRREFAKFEKERTLAKWDTGENPIYKQATSTFKNPTYAGK
ncbi:hypothetical protein LSTR_LSTR014396 [Laodelphax striatellus]|uniref:Integrin beta subunit cytoplasmic domain-containing protein n=1 Tax=Laodelphax striatellus TaxID=195883 RepID=A0A482WUP3_LAOST|nr:hypothetical protein LSTR_LSTR014396 [Laodelphax striatellus]